MHARLRLFHQRADEARVPHEQRTGLSECRQSGGAFDHEFIQTPLAKQASSSVTKEVVGIHVLLTRSFFGDGIPRRLLPRVLPAKPTSAPLRF
jgi:hypothetical protein